MKVVYETELQVAESSRGNKKFWIGRVLEDDFSNFYTESQYWQKTRSGESERIRSEPKFIEGKNIGKSNETTPRNQAIAEIESEKRRKQDTGYWDFGKEPPERFPLPMLAHRYDERGHDIKWPAYIQPKLDGFRCLSNGEIAWSRKGKPFVPAVQELLKFNIGNAILDGELMLPKEEFTFQETVSAVKRRNKNTPLLEYHVYDIMNENKTFKERHTELIGLFRAADLHERFKLVGTAFVRNESEMMEFHGENNEAGYEGTIIRNIDALYKIGHRSENLQKVKDFVDDEFTIVDVVDGEGREEGCAIFIVQVPKGTCDVRPRGTLPDRRKMFSDRKRLIGKQLTVKYQGFTDKGSLRCPSGITVRDYE